jgi:hypothetical protein
VLGEIERARKHTDEFQELAYLVWQLVLSEGNEPETHNAFPICTTKTEFDKSGSLSDLLSGVAEIDRARLPGPR